jgi:L-ribulokinase
MQTLADVLGMPVRVSASEQTCALGAAMFAATASGIYPDVTEAAEAMGCGCDIEFRPGAGSSRLYEEKYREYRALGLLVEEMGGQRRERG